VILGTAGAMTARTTTELFRADDHERLVARVLRLEELGGIVGLAVVAAYFRPQQEVTWQMPGTAWLMLTVGLGATLGLVCYFVFKRPQEGPEFVVLTLGAISFSAGVAGYLLLSPVVVAFVAGSCLTLLPTPHKHRIRAALRKLERPVYLVSLIAIGALWQVDDWRGWALAPVFTIARLVGKRFGVAVAAGATNLSITPQERQTLAVSPMGPLAIAIVVNAQLLYPGGSISPIVAAVIVGAILTEVVVQLASRRAPSTSRPPPTGPNQPVFSDPPEDVR
jgi:Kef-type K+ transport system membrane component KefB